MRPGLGTYAYRWSIGLKDRMPETPMTPLQVLDAAQALGLDLVQYADNMPLHVLSDDALDTLAVTARAKGIDLEVGTQCFDADDVARYIGIGRRIGAPLLRVALDAEDSRTPVPELAAQMRDLLADARAAGMRIAIENHFNYPSRQMVDLLDTVADPTLGVCLDVANSICAGEWPEETVRLLAPYTINLHLKDYVIDPDPYGVGFYIRGVPLGQGRAPIPWILDQLAHCAPDMSVILEHWLPGGQDMAAVRASEQVWIEQTVAAARRFLDGRQATRGR